MLLLNIESTFVTNLYRKYYIILIDIFLKDMYLTLDEIKKHLNIDPAFTDDDTYLQSLESVAVDVIERDVNIKFSELTSLPDGLKHALLLFIGNMYDNRESVAYTSVTTVQNSLNWILDMYRDYTTNINFEP